jgi:hypothetical protein
MKHTNTKLRGAVKIAAVAAIALAVAGLAIGTRTDEADAFGTVQMPVGNQRVVHEKITRVLSCTSTQKPQDCFEPMTIAMLAGTQGTFGGVGEPDNPLDGNPNPAARHCDEGDYGYGTDHSQEEAFREISNCLALYQKYMGFAVDAAAGLLNPDGTVNPAATKITNVFGNTYNACTLPDWAKGNKSSDSAKCNVLNNLGRALHIYEDFWSHSNWADVADPNKASDSSNPAGLGRTDQPDFFTFPGPVATSFPDGLMTGCDDSLNPFRCGNRIGHSTLNKDNGETVDPDRCTTDRPLTNRAKITTGGQTNFQRAVTGACGAALRAWNDLQAEIIARYGQQRGATMIRAITKDAGFSLCRVSGSAAKALVGPVGDAPSARSVVINVVNQSGANLTCTDAVLDGGEWASMPPDTVAPNANLRWRTQSNGLATGTEGKAVYRIDGTNSTVTFYWNNPYIGSNAVRCDAGPGFKCTTSGGKGNDATVTFTLTRA